MVKYWLLEAQFRYNYIDVTQSQDVYKFRPYYISVVCLSIFTSFGEGF